MSLADLEFVRTGNFELGKGSYGKVQLARHKKTGQKLAVKKIEKQSIAN